MKFDESKVYTALNADELPCGSIVFAADTISNLRSEVINGTNTCTVVDILPEDMECRFRVKSSVYNNFSVWFLAYLVILPEDKCKDNLLWTDLKVGDVIINGLHEKMVIEKDTDNNKCMHINAGGTWLTDDELKTWVKVDKEEC